MLGQFKTLNIWGGITGIYDSIEVLWRISTLLRYHGQIFIWNVGNTICMSVWVIFTVFTGIGVPKNCDNHLWWVCSNYFCGSICQYKCVFVVNSSGWILSVGVMKLDEGLFYTWVYVIDRGIRNGFDFEKIGNI